MDLEALTTRLGPLPALPAVVLELLALVDKPDAKANEVATTIGRDPALTAKLLSFVNAPTYAREHEVEKLTEAVTVLGWSTAVSLALDGSATASAQRASGGLDCALYWRRSLFAGIAAAELGSTVMGEHLREEFYLAGLLQDIGMLAIDQLEPDFYRPLGEERRHHSKVREHERRIMSADHATVGAMVLEQWHLAERTVMAVAASHRPQEWPLTQELGRFARAVALSGEVADLLMLGGSAPALEAMAERCREILQLERHRLDDVLAKINAKRPDLEALLDLSPKTARPSPTAPARPHGEQTQSREPVSRSPNRRESEAISLREQAEALGSDAEYRDPMSGAFSRKFLETYLPDLLETVRRSGRPLSLVFADITNFGEIQQHFGADDNRVLAGVARILEHKVRAGDVVVRYGDEIFLVVLPGAPPEAASRVCDRILSACSELRFPAGNEVVDVELAMGLATGGESQDIESAEALLAAANLALFEAKVTGKGKIAHVEQDRSRKPWSR